MTEVGKKRMAWETKVYGENLYISYEFKDKSEVRQPFQLNWFVEISCEVKHHTLNTRHTMGDYLKDVKRFMNERKAHMNY